MFSRENIEKLRNSVKNTLSEARYIHTLGVVNAAMILAKFCMPQSSSELEVAALLHDITKEYSSEKQLEIINEKLPDISDDDIMFPQIFHSFTSKFVVQLKYPEFATKNVLSAVFNHTLGAPDMSDFDEIIFISDFIEENRKYPASLSLRAFVFENMEEYKYEENLKILHVACVKAIDSTIIHLIDSGKRINLKNILTRNSLLSKI